MNSVSNLEVMIDKLTSVFILVLYEELQKPV
jgi:hypothetical protein